MYVGMIVRRPINDKKMVRKLALVIIIKIENAFATDPNSFSKLNEKL